MIDKMINTTLAAVIEISDQKNTILVRQDGETIMSELNSFKMFFNPRYSEYKDCFVKNIRASLTGLIIDIETPEEREATIKLDEWENEINGRAAVER